MTNLENVTIEQAIKKGHRMITWPSMLIMFGLMGINLYIGFQKELPEWKWPVGIVASIALAWIYWSVKVTQWKVWAFENVRNVHELEKRAIEQNLIYERSSVFNKTEIWSRADKEKWNLLQDKFEIKDEFVVEEDLTVPAETIIYYSKGKNYLEMLIMLGLLAWGVYMIIKTDWKIMGSLLSIMAAYLAFKEYKEATNTEAQIILNEKGIQTISTEFNAWKDIENEDVEIQRSGKHTHYYLSYEHPNGLEWLLIDEFEIDFKELRKLLKIYRSRSMNQH